MINLKEICDKLNFVPKKIFEVGVFEPHSSHVLPFLEQATEVHLFEPHPFYAQRLKVAFSRCPHVQIHQVAIWERNEMLKLFDRSASTFVQGVTSPAKINDGYAENDSDSFFVDGKRFGQYDTGGIDLFAIDTEGCEWFAIRELKSRPKVICVETHGMNYKNPYYFEIFAWAEKNGYKVFAQDVSDTVFVHE